MSKSLRFCHNVFETLCFWIHNIYQPTAAWDLGRARRRYVMAELRLKGSVLWFNKLCD